MLATQPLLRSHFLSVKTNESNSTLSMKKMSRVNYIYIVFDWIHMCVHACVRKWESNCGCVFSRNATLCRFELVINKLAVYFFFLFVFTFCKQSSQCKTVGSVWQLIILIRSCHLLHLHIHSACTHRHTHIYNLHEHDLNKKGK